MGRDDANALPVLQGGRAPARAFHDFMVKAVAGRPIQPFEIEVKLPDWQLEPDEEVWFEEPDDFMMVDPDGNPIYPGGAPGQPLPPGTGPGPIMPGQFPRAAAGEKLDKDWLDRALGRDQPPPGDKHPGRLSEHQHPPRQRPTHP